MSMERFLNIALIKKGNRRVILPNFKSSVIFLCAIACLAVSSRTSAETVQERLGYPASARLLVIHADDFGMNHSTNRAISAALEKGWVTSASVMVPCPWFPEAVRFARAHPGIDLGVHQTLTSEWRDLRWGPVSSKDKVPSLLDADGYLPPDGGDVTWSAEPAEVEAELRAQIERALKMGIRVTHLDTHMRALFTSDALFRVYVKMGHAYDLPVLSAEVGAATDLQPANEILVTRIIAIEPGVPAQDWTDWYEKALAAQGPGVYQLVVHLAYDDEEMRGTAWDHPDWGAAWRQHDLDMVKSLEFRKFLKDQGFILVNWKDLARALPKDYGKNGGR
jgi:chitin disaccharide deacetylase